MQFDTLTSPFSCRPNKVADSMRWVLIALLPGILAMWHFFGWGVLVNVVLAAGAAVACEALALKLRGKPIAPVLSDLSALVTGVLLALTLPPLLPWWLTLLGVAFAILLVKHAYGGLGYNAFNPAMAGYVFLLISWPVHTTVWLPTVELQSQSLGLSETLGVIFTGQLPLGTSWDAITGATPLAVMKHELDAHHTLTEIARQPIWGVFGGKGWEWVAGAFLLGGLVLLRQRIISWHIPIAMLAGLLLAAGVTHLWDADAQATPLFHLFSGGAMLGAFFIATDPVTACTTKRGQLVFGLGIGVLVFVIRTWGGYPDAVAFAVLLFNVAAPTIDHYTQPRVFGHRGGSV